VCESAGISDVVVQENQFTSMANTDPQTKRERSDKIPIKICHIGGMSLHKGYQLLRRAVHSMQPGLNLEFTVVDHRLSTKTDEYDASWNGYPVRFIAPVPMDEMNLFYASQEVLVAPSIWPESFGLVTREALSARLWVIASNSGALAEPLLNSESPHGTVVRPNELDDLIQALTDCPHRLREHL
jgi:glycosyltransferase involved in cell wall biosynthesis